MRSMVWLDGELRPAGDACVPALSAAVLYGEGLFETLRVYAGKPFLLAEHLERMARSASALGIRVPLTVEAIRDAAAVLIRASEASEAVLRVSLLAGVGDRSHLLLSLRDLPEDLERRQSHGIRATTARAGSLPLAAHKSTSYLRMRAVARQTDAPEIILIDDQGKVLEGTRSNVFALMGNRLMTPPTGRILPGITRRRILELAPRAGLEAEERVLETEDLFAARAVAVTSSVMEIVPVVALDGKPVGGGRPEAVLARLRDLYREGCH